MTKTIAKAYVRRFYPTFEQASLLAQTFGCARLVYNMGLELCQKSWKENGETVRYSQLCKALTAWKQQEELAFLQDVSIVNLQQTLKNLDTGLQNFFDGRARYPKFKSRKRSKASVRYTNRGFSVKNGRIKLAKMKEPLVLARRDEPVPWGKATSVTVSRDADGRYFISALCEVSVDELPVTGKTIGIDVGVKDYAVLSDGRKFNPEDSYNRKKKQRDSKRKQRSMSRKQKGSKNRAKARTKYARALSKERDAKRDWLHKLTSQLVKEFDVICIEDLSIRGMSRKAKGRGKAQKAGLNRAILDNNLHEFRTMLEYKADWYGKRVVLVDRFYPSSKTCAECGHVRDTLPLSVRYWTCESCGESLDRDINASKNIHTAGLAVYACGDDVRPVAVPSGTSNRLLSQKQETSGGDTWNPRP